MDAGDENGGEGGEDEENVNNYKEEENGDKEENEFVVWADGLIYIVFYISIEL